MQVLGVDPGTVRAGWGVVDAGAARLRYVGGGTLRATGGLAERLARLFDGVGTLLDTFRPAGIALETSFVGSNVQSAFRLGEARGAILVAAARAGVPVWEYSPAEIKVAVTGHGAATKPQVQGMVARLLGMDAEVPPDEADALAAAICHLHSMRFLARVGAPAGGLGARRRGGRTARGPVAGRVAPRERRA